MPAWTYYGPVPVHLDSQNGNTEINSNIINGIPVQIQYTDLQHYENATSVTTLPVIQTSANGEDVYHAGLEAQDFYIPSATMNLQIPDAGSLFSGANPIAVCTPVQNLPDSVNSEGSLGLATSGATFLPQESITTGTLGGYKIFVMIIICNHFYLFPKI